jgi:hypothetical protein
LNLEECLKRLRYVELGYEVTASDVNVKAECLRILKNEMATLARTANVAVDPLVDELDSILALIRYVKTGDLILPEDHNLVVDALRKARDILRIIEKTVTEELDVCKTELDMCKTLLAYYRALAREVISVSLADVKADIALPRPIITISVSPADVKTDITPPRPIIDIVGETAKIHTETGMGILVSIETRIE